LPSCPNCWLITTSKWSPSTRIPHKRLAIAHSPESKKKISTLMLMEKNKLFRLCNWRE
jgi:hypothetical protein